MSTKFEIIKSEFITTDYPKELKYIHWSRIYEWKYVIDSIQKYKPNSIHNTACGGLNVNDCLHLTFCDDIEFFCKNSIHSDLWGGSYPGTQVKPDKNNYIFYDISKSFDEKFDMVLNISTLEHLSKNDIIVSLNNLINQVNIGGHLILTFDYPDISINEIENYFNLKIIKQNNLVTNGLMSVVLIHLVKI